MTTANLYDSHWLVAYEAFDQGWLPARTDYIAADEFFSILRQHAVRFYSDGLAVTTSFSSYSEDDEEDLGRADVDELPAVPFRLHGVSGQ